MENLLKVCIVSVASDLSVKNKIIKDVYNTT
jgi:hypothetical protein